MNILGKWSHLPFFTQERWQKGEKRGFVYACNQTQLDDFVHKQTIICRQLFAGHGGGLSANEKEEQFAWKSYSFCFFFRISNQALLSQMKHLKNWRTAFVVLLLQLVLYSLLCFFIMHLLWGTCLVCLLVSEGDLCNLLMLGMWEFQVFWDFHDLPRSNSRNWIFITETIAKMFTVG